MDEFGVSTTEGMDTFITALTGKSEEAAEAGKEVSDSAADGADSKYSKFLTAGEYAGDGFIKGLLRKKAKAYNIGYEIGDEAARGMEAGLDEQSPSKRTEKIGVFADEGLIIGLLKKKKDVYDAGTYIGTATMSGISTALQLVSETIQNGIDVDPTIRPVIDLTDINNKTAEINALFAESRALRTQASFDVVSSKPSGSSNQSNADASENPSVAYYQYNYSPKALSRLEIYRQTKNQLSMMKGVARKKV